MIEMILWFVFFILVVLIMLAGLLIVAHIVGIKEDPIEHLDE